MQLQYQNLVGRPWIPNEDDCFTKVIDFYDQNFGIKIPNFARPVDWQSDKLDLIGKLYKKTGFKMLPVECWDELRPADLLAVSVGSSKPNHLIIVLEANQILHHKFGVLSQVETMRPAWKTLTSFILRHPDVPDLTPQLPDVTIEELLRANRRI